jgi:hypothetical protein
MGEPVVIRVTPFPQEMRPDSESMDEGWIPFFASLEGPTRIIARTERFDLSAPLARTEQRLRALRRREAALRPVAGALRDWDSAATPAALSAHLATLPTEQRSLLGDKSLSERRAWQSALDVASQPLWRLKWLQDERQMYTDLMDGVALRGLHHYIVCWQPDHTRPDDQVATIAQTFDTTAGLADLPPLLPGVYEEQFSFMRPERCCLAPQEPEHPLVAMLVAYDMAGVWDVWTLERILGLDIDLAICIDIGTVSRAWAEQQVSFVKASRRNAIKNSEDGGHSRTVKKLTAAEYIEQVLDDGQSLHDLRLIIAVQGRDLDTLNANVRQVITAGGARLKLVRPPGGQTQLTQFFTTTPTKQIGGFAPSRREPSHAAAVMVPFGIRKPDRTDGLLWIIQGADTPIFFDPIQDRQGDKRAGHIVVLGKTGSGKTFTSFVWAMRMLEAGYQVVFFEPQGHSRRLITACGRGGARYELTMRQSINILDVAVGRDNDGNPPAVSEQIQHVIGQLSTILGQVVPTSDGKGMFLAHQWDAIERALLDHALAAVYAPWAHDLETLTVDKTPTLSDLCDALSGLDIRPGLAPIRDRLLDTIYLSLVTGTQAATYNRTTTVDWDFSHDATAYDFTAMGKGSSAQVLFTAQALGALNRYIRSATRDRNRPIFCFFDEFAYTLGKSPEVASWAAEASKTWRTFRAGLVTMDQDAHTYLGVSDETAVGALRSVFDNATIKLIMRQDPLPAERLGQVIGGLQPLHIQSIKQMQKGGCVLIWESDDENHQHNEVFVGRAVPTDLEMLAFGGT